MRRVGLDTGQMSARSGARCPRPTVDGRAIGLFEAVFHIPDLLGNRGGETGHGESSDERRKNYYMLMLRFNEIDYHVWTGEESVDKSLHLIKLCVGANQG